MAGKADKKDKEKLSKFPEILCALRKERGISQKRAAQDLGISQALLSHYEKGIRECGLDFVIRCSEYYGVTADYLLGISDNRTGFDASSFTNDATGEMSLATLAGATQMLIDMIGASKNESAIGFCFDYYTLSLYRGALTMAKAGILPTELFKLDLNLGRELASAAIAVEDAKFIFVEDKSRTGGNEITNSALNTLIESAEKKILSSFYIE